jgi:predicted enzyme related to lactoylglutathione lyase
MIALAVFAAAPACRQAREDAHAPVMPSLPTGRSAPTVVSLAMRVHQMERLEAFYHEAFGVTFRTVQTGPFPSRYGELDGMLLKLVPIRDSSDFSGFPVHQLGVEVPDIAHVVASAIRHGGVVQDSVTARGDSLVGSIRDPDGNTIELHQLRRRGP